MASLPRIADGRTKKKGLQTKSVSPFNNRLPSVDKFYTIEKNIFNYESPGGKITVWL